MSLKNNVVVKFNSIFQSCLLDAARSRDSSLARPLHDFSRSSPLSLHKTLLLPFLFDHDSIDLSLVRWNHTMNVDVLPSAVTASRLKIRSDAYINIFNAFNRKSESTFLFKGRRILGVDGSDQAIYGTSSHSSDCLDADSSENSDPYLGKTRNGHKRRFCHINSLYDCLENTYVDFVLQPGSQTNEDEALLELCESLNPTSQKAIICADRGYQSLMSFYRLEKMGHNFAIRIMDQNSKGCFTRDFNLPDQEVYDLTHDLLLSRDHKVKLLRRMGETRPIKYIASHDRYEEFDLSDKLDLTLRITRIKTISFIDPKCPKKKSRQGTWIEYSNPDQPEPLTLGDGTIIRHMDDIEKMGFKITKTSFITIASNLEPDEFTAADVAEIYRKRWLIETSFRHIKGDLNLGDLHSRIPELIRQEVYAKATAYNLCSRIRNDLELEREHKKNGRKERKLNFGYLIRTMVYHMFPDDPRLCDQLRTEILRHTHQSSRGLPDTRKQGT